MNRFWNNEEHHINKFNGQMVMATLSFLGNKATKNDLVSSIVSMTNQPHEAVDQELDRILGNGVNCGYIRKIGNDYLLPIYHSEFETDSGAGHGEDSGSETDDEDSESEIDDKADFLTDLEEMMKLSCRAFRTKLLDRILDVVMGQCKEANLEQLKCQFSNQILHLSTIPDEGIDTCTKVKLVEFFSSAFELIHLHDVRESLLRYTVNSVDKWIMEHNLCSFGPAKQQAIKGFIKLVIELEQGDCEKFRTVYIHHLLNKVVEALREGTQYASEVFLQLNLEDRCESFSETIKNVVQKAFDIAKSGSCPIHAYFQFLSDRRAKACKAAAARRRKKK